MAVYQIVTKEDDLLRKVSKPVPTITPNVLKLIENMKETMYKANGVGIAAPQVGVLKRIIIVDVGDGPIVLINPEITAQTGLVKGIEGCLSCPNVIGEVARATTITLKGLLPTGEETAFEAEGYLARAFQHEIDHLNGVLFIDKAFDLRIDE